MNSRAYCQQKVASSGSSFYYSFLFLPDDKKRAITAIYAFCREVDDIVDECKDIQIAEQKLTWWTTEVQRIFTGNAQHPVGIELQHALQNFKLSRMWFDEVIQGMFMDLRYHGYHSFDDLKLYCHRVASVVGMMAATVFGYQDHQTLEYAKKLGLAFQLVNIIRDVGEDARRGRIYLAEEDLVIYNIKPQDILSLKIQDQAKFKELLTKYATLARSYYASAMQALPDVDRANQRSGLIMARIYFCLLDEIERSGFDVMPHKITITPLRKLWLAWRTYRQEKKLPIPKAPCRVQS